VPRSSLQLTTIAFCAALNVGVGFLVQAVKLPIYLDSIGTIIATALLGITGGIAAGLTGIVFLALFTAPNAIAYSGTVVVIAIVAQGLMRIGYLRTWWATLLGGVAIGIAAAVVSAPVTTYLFGGVSLAGADAITAFIRATGATLQQSVLLGGLATDPVDKVLVSVLAMLMLRSLPANVRSRYPRL
jgi:energy-coupling factor transport system substrate-specific component